MICCLYKYNMNRLAISDDLIHFLTIQRKKTYKNQAVAIESFIIS
ncbi:hypothetical protein HMPREF1051_0763 [Neisseria sicca VK64]|uniref:Uncharacterized protein n=1 Tax=Neisseria sicca VK64 TaxID=1095748 RepID=I2NQG5_NEISI|nr:hypothetical protein HMPREF1051_0763 [Neisseria sicca VK64]